MKINVCIEANTIEEYLEAIQALAAGYTVAPQPSIAASLVGKQESASTVVGKEDESSEPKEQSYHRTAKKYYNELLELDSKEAVRIFNSFNVEGIDYLNKVNCAKFSVKLREAIAKAQGDAIDEAKAQQKEAEELEKQADKAIEESGPKHGFPAVKLAATKLQKITDGKAEVKALLEKYNVKKLSELTEDQYDAFHDEAVQIVADHDNAPVKEAETPSTTEDTSTTEKVETKEDSGVTIQMIREKAKEIAVKFGNEPIKIILNDLGAKNLSSIKPEDFEEFYTRLQG